MTREELHQLVWSKPIRTVAKSMAISDVALAKQCRRANVPVPPRGWWARKEAGKQVEVEPLPPLPFAMANYFPALATPTPQPAEQRVSELAAPVFRDMEVVSQEFASAVKPIKVPTALINPHPTVARLLKQDEERRTKHAVSDHYGPKFDSAVEQRRLRILSSILRELERLGCKIQGSTHAGERFSICVGGHWTYIYFHVEGGMPAYFAPYAGRSAQKWPPATLRFDLVDHSGRDKPVRSWMEKEKPLEAQATDIVCGILLRVEKDMREWAIWRHNYDLEERVRRAREAKIAAQKAEADRIAREKAAAAARITALIDGADALERAARIRRYVETVRAHAIEGALAPPEELDAWTAWALNEADSIDPVLSGRFISNLALP